MGPVGSWELDLGQDTISYLSSTFPILMGRDGSKMTFQIMGINTTWILCSIILKIFGHSHFPSVQLSD